MRECELRPAKRRMQSVFVAMLSIGMVVLYVYFAPELVTPAARQDSLEMRPNKKLKKIFDVAGGCYRFNKSQDFYELGLIHDTERILKLLWPLDNVGDIGVGPSNDLNVEGLKLISHARDLRELSLNFYKCDISALPPEAFRYVGAISQLEYFFTNYEGDIDEA